MAISVRLERVFGFHQNGNINPWITRVSAMSGDACDCSGAATMARRANGERRRRWRGAQCGRHVRADMLCPARCSCFLCRELQSCHAADARKPKHNMCDNFILKKAEAWEPMKFIRGAARLSVRHWQSREPITSTKTKITTHKSTSCEQLYPHPLEDEVGPFGMRRAPSTDRVKPQSEHNALFKLLGNSRSKKMNSGDGTESKVRRSVLNFRKNENHNSKNVHEKYIPLPQVSSPAEHIYSEPKPFLKNSYTQLDDCCRPPVYQSVEKKNEDNTNASADKKLYSNRLPCYDELAQRLSQDKSKKANLPLFSYLEGGLANKITQNNNKVVIYFGDSIIRKHNDQRKDELKWKEEVPREEVIYANRLPDETCNIGIGREVDKGGGTQMVSEVEVPEAIYSEVKANDTSDITINDATYKKDIFETKSSDGFVIVEFESNFERARQLVELVHGGSTDHHEATVLDEDDLCDWSFIQDWRKRPSSGCRPSDEGAWCGGVSGARALRVRVSGGAAAPAPAHARRLSPPPPAHTATTPCAPGASSNKVNHEDTVQLPPDTPSAAQLMAITAVSQLTAASAPVRSAPAQSSYALERRPKHDHHHRAEQLPPVQNGVRECNSSSDENRSSGHASMSDSGGGGEAGREEPRRTRQPPHARNKHRPHNKLQSPWPGGGGLEDIRSAIKQLTLRSRDSSSTATSGASSAGGGSNNGVPETGSAAEARRRRAPLVRQPSLDTVCTNVTSADEFVWVDSHNRLVELRCVPWTPSEVSRALQAGRCRDVAPRMAPDTPPRLAYLLQRALVRISREAQRLSQNFGFCSKHEVAGAFKIVLSTPLADACIKGCQRAATMYATSGSAARRLGSASRARTSLAPGRFQRWMLDVRVASFVHEYAAIYLCAGMETLLEEIALIAGGSVPSTPITPAAVDHAVANCADLWGLLQPYSHLNAGRVASGALSLSRWESMSSLGSGSGSSSGVSRPEHRQLGLSHDSGITTNGSGGSGTSAGSNNSGGSTASVLLTTCAGSAAELRAVLRRVHPRLPPLAPAAERALYYFMRCSQLEHSSAGGSGGAGAGCGGAGLWGARGAGALPPLGEWLRVLRAHAALRPAPAAPDADDVLQAARLLLPHADCPPRPVTLEEAIEPAWSRCNRTPDELSRAALGLAQRALLSGRSDLVGGVRALLPTAGIDTTDASGLTALMKASLAGDEQIVAMLLEAGADPNIETGGACAAHCAVPLSPRSPSTPQSTPSYTPPTAGWTALVYACGAAGGGAAGAAECARRLLAAGARADGAPARGDDVCTLTPLQVACGVGNLELVQLLLSHGADPFLSTQLNDALCYSAAAQYGCYSAVAVCCSHGRRACLRAAVRGGARGGGAGGAGAVLSLEEVLAEGAPASPRAPTFTKQQQRALHHAMYCAAETDHLDITLELRTLGVPWSLHAWTLSLAAAADAALDHVIDQLLQDFLQVCPSDDSHYSKQFIYECLPLLFNILRYSKKEGTVLLLADILCACYGREAVPPVAQPPPPAAPAPARVDPSYVNNPSLADVTFRVEGRLFYGHKIVLVSESPRMRAMLAPPRPSNEALPPTNSTPPLVQINDIRYHIFEQVMKYLYSGGCSGLEIPEGDVLEVLAAASFFQLLPLQRHCEARAAKSVDLHNLVSVYIHAKVYGATQLLEYCQGFLLQNMVALLTYDDSVKRLLFGKRLPGHNVLGALLTTLQKRIEARKNQAKTR